jgi:hypothetical protein
MNAVSASTSGSEPATGEVALEIAAVVVEDDLLLLLHVMPCRYRRK